jgi:curved DNA-binding protein CbpA
MVTVDPYGVLGIERRAPEADIKRAYFQLVRQFPPERSPAKFQEIRAAYELLRDPERRAQIDLFLLQPPPPLPRRRSPSYDLTVHPQDLIALLVDAVTPPLDGDFEAL